MNVEVTPEVKAAMAAVLVAARLEYVAHEAWFKRRSKENNARRITTTKVVEEAERALTFALIEANP